MIRKRNGIKELEIFWEFVKDRNLPKFKKKERISNGIGENVFDGDVQEGVTIGVALNDESSIWVNGRNVLEDKKNVVFYKRFIIWLYDKIITKKKQSDKKRLATILSFFISLSGSFKELTPLAKIADHYETALKQAVDTGQDSLRENLENILEASRTEAHLIQNKLTQYVTEGQIIDFYETADEDKHLKLTWIKNFVKVIPSELVDLKKTLDKKELFDNYVILHYDPNNDATNLTKEEVEVKKDPILFGVIENSRKLYYIGDWKDDYCDLTLEGMFIELGEKVFSINNRTVKTFISSGGKHLPKRKKKK